MVLEFQKPLLKYIATTRPAWRIMIEDEVVRIMTGALVLSWPVLKDIETEFGFEIYDIIYTPNYGITISMKKISH